MEKETMVVEPTNEKEVSKTSTEATLEDASKAKPSDQESEKEKYDKRILDLEKEAAYYRGIAESRPVENQSKTEEQKEKPLVPPKIDDFKTYEEYEEAREEYLLAKAEKRLKTKALEEQQIRSQQVELQKIESQFMERIEKASETDPGLRDLLNDRTLPVSNLMAMVIKKFEVAPQIIRHLDQNRKDAKKISGIQDPIEVAQAIAEIAAEIKYKEKKVEPPKKVSQAPEPIVPLKAEGQTDVDEDSLPMEEWVRRRNEKQFGKRR